MCQQIFFFYYKGQFKMGETGLDMFDCYAGIELIILRRV